MKIVDQIVAWLIVLMGVVHSAFTPGFTLGAMWFLGTGLFIVLVGAVNLLRVRYASAARGVQGVAIAANVIAVAYDLAVSSRLNVRANPQALIMVVLLVLATVFSIIPPKRAQEPDKLVAAR